MKNGPSKCPSNTIPFPFDKDTRSARSISSAIEFQMLRENYSLEKSMNQINIRRNCYMIPIDSDVPDAVRGLRFLSRYEIKKKTTF